MFIKPFLCLAFVLFLSCSNGTEITQNSNKYQLLNDIAEDISISYFNEDKLEFKLIASEMSQGSNENIFQSGIEVYVFNVKLDTILTIKSDYAFQNKIDDVFEAKKNVILINSKNEQLMTEHLVWNTKSKTIYTEELVTIKTDSQIIMGYGFETDENFESYTLSNLTGKIYL